MADEEVLRRIDAHMARSNEIFEDHRHFLRELTLRQERVFRAMIDRLDEQGRAIREQGRAIREQGRAIREQTQQMREQTEQMRAQRREFVEESRAQRAALFRMLDRLDGGADPAGA
jgi:uncharacterized coiled-coil DUF342 family protein